MVVPALCSVGQTRFRFDLDLVTANQSRDDDQRVGRLDLSKHTAMRAGDGFDIGLVGDVDARADDILSFGAKWGERGEDFVEDVGGLCASVVGRHHSIRAMGCSSARDEDAVALAPGTAISRDILPYRAGKNLAVFASIGRRQGVEVVG